MSGELMVQDQAYGKIIDLMAFIREMGRAIALSKMFGCDSEPQGQVMALECVSRRMPPMQIAERYHLIHGKLSLKSEAMLADFRTKMGGSYRIIERTDRRAAIELTLDGQVLMGEFTWDDARKEPFVYETSKDLKESKVVELINSGKTDKLALKAKYATPRSRTQMLWARVVSDTVRAMAPEVTSGSYTPEEISDFDGDGNTSPWTADEPATTRQSAAGSQTVAADGSSVVTSAEVTATEAAFTEASSVAYATAEQAEEIVNLIVDLGITHEQQQAIMAKRNVRAWRSLTTEQANDLLAGLRKKAEAARQVEADTSQATAVNVAGKSVPNNSPCSQVQIDTCKGLIREMSQIDSAVADKVMAKLKESGLAKLADMTQTEADQLTAALRVKNLELFFAASLAGHAKFKQDVEPAAGDSSGN